MYKLCVFAGTTEGRELVELLADQPVKVISAVPLKVFRGTKDRSFMDRWP